MNLRRYRTTALAWSLACLGFANVCPADETKEPPPSAHLPEMFAMSPLGAARGKTVEVEILGENLLGIERLEVSGSGVTARITQSSWLGAKAEIVVDAAAEPGVRGVRAFSPLGVSNLLGFRVGEFPELHETEPNNSRETALHIEAPAIVDAGLLSDEDTDFYRLHATAGERLLMEVLAARDGSGLNSQMYLLDSDGRRLAVGDDEAAQDPVIDHVFDREGEYFLVVRGIYSVLNMSFPTGHPAYHYQLRLISPPVIETVTPPAVAAGATTEIEISGTGLDAVTQLGASPGVAAKIVSRSSNHIRAQMTAAAAASGIPQLWAESSRGLSRPLRVAVSDASPVVAKISSHGKESAQRLNLPGVVEGVIDEPGEEDAYSFSISEPGAYVFEVEAGRLNSLLDSVLTLKNSAGEVLASNDDGLFDQAAEGDSKILYRFAERGDYRLQIKQAVLDLHGPDYGYRLIARKARPRFTLSAAAGGQNAPWAKSADRVTANPGSTISIPVKVTWLEGLEADGTDIELQLKGLPSTIQTEPFTASVHEGKHEDNSRYSARFEIPLTVPSGAVLGNYPFRVTGEARHNGEVMDVEESINVTAAGRYVMAATSGVSQSLSARYLSVVEPVKFTLRPEIGDERYPVRFTIQPGTSKTLLLTVLSEEFPEHLDFTSENLPRGLTIQKVECDPKMKQYTLHLNAEASGERGWFPVVTLIANDPVTGVVIPTPYFGLAVQ